MTRLDFNLLVTLDVLLTERSVVRAAQRLQLSSSAMSRALARLRETTGDPLLVRAGRGLVPTPRALEIRDRVSLLVDEVQEVLRPQTELKVDQLERIFTLRTGEGFVETFGPKLVERVSIEAPGVLLRFIPKLDKDSSLLRDGLVDLETGVLGTAMSPEIRMQGLFRDRFIGVVRMGHELFNSTITAESYTEGKHVSIWRRGLSGGPVDQVLETLGLARNVVTMVGGFSSALYMARGSDLIATVPERNTEALRKGMHSFPLPFSCPEVTVSMFWHPRMGADPAHRWLRECIQQVCKDL